MNIFNSLTRGDGSISETNITSFLSSLLSSSNEFENSFFLLFLELIDKNLQENKIGTLLQIQQPGLRERIINFSKNYTVSAVPEFAVKKDIQTQYIDIFVQVSYKNKKDEAPVAYLLIENKIKISALKKMQVSNQYEFFIQSKEYQAHVPVYSVLLTCDHDGFITMLNAAKEKNRNSLWLRWTNQKEKENSLESILRNLIICEQQAEIQPINPNTQFILKSFIDYLVTEFSNSSSGLRNFNFNGSDEVEMAKIFYNNRHYIIRRYENKMIRIFDEDDNIMDIEVLPLLRNINLHFNLAIDINHSSGTPKNTQIFGKEVIHTYNLKFTL